MNDEGRNADSQHDSVKVEQARQEYLRQQEAVSLSERLRQQHFKDENLSIGTNSSGKSPVFTPSGVDRERATRFISTLVALLGTMVSASSIMYLAGKTFFPVQVTALFDEGLFLPVFGAFSGILIAVLSRLWRSHEPDSFFEIDKAAQSRALNSKIASLENELEQARQALIAQVSSANTLSSGIILSGERIEPFRNYVDTLISSLDRHIELAEEKASKLLDKGTLYLRRGIYFYVATIMVWQVVAIYGDGMSAHLVVGVISCSLTFLVIEFLAAWFLKQYRGFVDAAAQLVRIKSIFNKVMLSYFAVKESSSKDVEVQMEMHKQLMRMLEQDISWTDSKSANDVGHMVEMFQSVSGVIEKLKDVMPKRNASE